MMGILLLAGWVGVSLIGMRQWQQFHPRFLFGPANIPAQLVTTISLTLLLAMFPISAAVAADTDWRRRRQLKDPALGVRPPAVILIVLLAGAIILALINVPILLTELWHRTACLAAVIFLALLAPTYLLRITARGGARGMVLIVAWFILTWIGPIMAEIIIHVAAADAGASGEFPGAIAGISPPVAIYQILLAEVEPTTPGIIAHAAAAGLFALLFYRARRSGLSRERRAPGITGFP
jgi:hypothetical protein